MPEDLELDRINEVVHNIVNAPTGTTFEYDEVVYEKVNFLGGESDVEVRIVGGSEEQIGKLGKKKNDETVLHIRNIASGITNIKHKETGN